MSRSLPELIALPIGEYLKHFPVAKDPPGGRVSRIKPFEFPANPAIPYAIDSLRSVMALTLNLIGDGPSSHVLPVSHALNEVFVVLEMLEEELRGDCPGGIVTLETEGVEELTLYLDLAAQIEDRLTDKSAQLSRFLKFWLLEIERRIRELFNILIMSVDCREAEKVFRTINTLNYPKL